MKSYTDRLGRTIKVGDRVRVYSDPALKRVRSHIDICGVEDLCISYLNKSGTLEMLCSLSDISRDCIEVIDNENQDS